MRQPPAVLVIAILSLIGGGFGTCCGLASVSEPLVLPLTDWFIEAVLLGGGNDPEHEPPALTLGESWHAVFAYALAVLDLLLSVLMVLAGLALLGRRPWGRVLALVCAVLVILTSLVRIAEALYVWAFLADELSAAMPAPLGRGLSVLGSLAVTEAVVVSLLWVAYGVAVLVVLLRPSAAAAFRSPPREAGAGGPALT